MRKFLLIILSCLTISYNIFADSFTDAIQDLAIQTACVGQYSATQAGGGWYNDPHDYYTPQMMAERFSKMSGNMTRTTTFYGICFDYAQFAYEDIKKYKNWYNEKGMYENQFYLSGAHDNSNQIILSYPTTQGNHNMVQNGVYVKEIAYRDVKTHSNATNHAWIWIERADGVWFWIDPTWTDNTGYVWYGYISPKGEEIQCQPDKKFCQTYPAELDNLPSPPAMGARKASSSTAKSTRPEETVVNAGTDWFTVVLDETVGKAMRKTFIDVDYKLKDEYLGLIVSADIPFSSITEKSLSLNKIGLGLEFATLFNSIAGVTGFEYLRNFEDENKIHAGIIYIDLARRLFNNITWFVGGGVGYRYNSSDEKDKNNFAGKANTGFIISISNLLTKVDVSYNNILGFSVGVGVGYGFNY